MVKASDNVTLKGTILRRTDKAIQFQFEDDGKTEWFPVSQMSENHESGSVGEDTIVVSKWICDQKGIEY